MKKEGSRVVDSISERTTDGEGKELTMESQQALAELLALGVGLDKAQQLTKELDPGTILDATEYVTPLIQADKNRRIQNPTGLLIYYLHNDMNEAATAADASACR